jgi:hypothetical protein
MVGSQWNEGNDEKVSVRTEGLGKRKGRKQDASGPSQVTISG